MTSSEERPANGKASLQALGFGDSMVDLTTFAPALPPRGGNVWSTAPELRPGGTVANVSADLAVLGIRSGFAGGIGKDPYGGYLLDTFKEAGVDVADVVIYDDAFTGIIFAIVDADGERTFVACAKGSAYARLQPDDVARIEFGRARLVHSSGVCLVEEPSRTALLSGFALLSSCGIPLYYDPNLRMEADVFPEALRKAQDEALHLADVVLIGEDEVGMICPGECIEEQASTLLEWGAELVVIKQGGEGATAYSASGEVHLPAFDVEVVDTTGAGDAFNAGFITARLRNYDLNKALQYACGVAGIKVSRSGARSVPSHEEVMQLLSQRG